MLKLMFSYIIDSTKVYGSEYTTDKIHDEFVQVVMKQCRAGIATIRSDCASALVFAPENQA